MRRFGDTQVESGSESDRPRLAVDDQDRLIFRKRAAVERSSNWSAPLMWILLALALTFVLLLLMQARPDRTSGIVGSNFQPERASETPVPPSTPSSQQYAPVSNPVPMVYRCVGKGGAVSLQSQPCSADQRVTRAIYAPPEVERARRPAIVSSTPTQTISYSSGPSVADYERERRRAACANAKAYREDTLARVGLKRTYDLLQRLDAMVYEACKGQ